MPSLRTLLASLTCATALCLAAGSAGAQPATDATAAMRTIVASASNLARSPSRWTGAVTPNPRIDGGLTDWTGGVALSPWLMSAADPAVAAWRDQTLTHEAMHTISRGVSALAYDANPGWEEGVAEGMRRVVQGEVLGALGYSPDEAAQAMAAFDASGGMYANYMRALDCIQQALGIDAPRFYGRLIVTPLPRRRAAMRALLQRTPGIRPALRRAALAQTTTRAVLMRPHDAVHASSAGL